MLVLPVTQTNLPLSAGSLSPVLSTNGVSFEGIAPTVGQYGFVILSTRLGLTRPTPEPGTYMLLLARYTLSRA